MNKVFTYSLYLFDYLKNGDLLSVLISLNYLIRKKSHRSNRTIKTSVGKFFCRKETNDFQFANFYYEWNVKKYILKQINSFSVFIEAGSCIGEYCILMASHGKTCFAFEPVTDNFKVLKKNVELNNFQDKIRILNFGLGAKNYTTAFKFNPVNTGATKMTSINSNDKDVAEITKLDDYFSELNIDVSEKILLKLDIEGMEAEALIGATQFIKTYPNVLLIIEDKHSGKETIYETLNTIAVFECSRIDEFNVAAKKIKNI